MISSPSRTVAQDVYDGLYPVTGPTCHEPGCRGYGKTDSGVVFIGIAPGRDEVQTGRPFTGPSGRLLNGLLKAAGFPRGQVYCTNMICWWKDDPSAAEAARCAPRLFAELREIRPKLIVLMGGVVTEIMTGEKLGKIRGAVVWNPQLNAYVMATYHPAAILHGRGERLNNNKRAGSNVAFDLLRDLSKIAYILKWAPGAPNAQVDYQLCETKEAAQAALDGLPRDGTPVALDTETDSPSVDEIDVFVNGLLCLAFSTGEQTYVLPAECADWNLRWPKDVAWTFHNALFDVQVVHRHLKDPDTGQGVWLDVHEDTMLMSYSVDERPGYHRLKPLAREYLGAGFWEADRKKIKGSLSNLPKEVLYKYNAHDAAYTARLVPIFKPWQEKEGTRQVYETIMIPAINAFKEIQYYGCKIDPVQLKEFAQVWGKWYLELEQELIDMARFYGWNPDEDINLDSPKQVGKFIYDILSLPMQPGKRGKGGQTVGARSTSQETLEALRGAHPFIDKLLEFRHVAHQYSVYIIGLIRNMKFDGRVHATVKLHGTVTGRLAYTDPPLQTIPRPYKFEDTFGMLRKLFVPSNDDMVIIEADYGKAEIWCAYHYSQDPQLLADLLSGDYHSTVAADVLDKPYKSVTKRDRRDMKLITFGVMYGREEASLADGIQKSRLEARDYIKGFFRRNARYSEYVEETIKLATKAGELVSHTGRKRRFMFIGQNWDHRSTKQAVNFPIQSTTSDCTLSSLIELHPLLKAIGAHILISVHDSIILEAPKSRAQEACRLLHDVMTKTRFPGFVPIPIELKVGPNWWAAKEAHNCEDKGGCLDARRDGIKDYEPTFKWQMEGAPVDSLVH